MIILSMELSLTFLLHPEDYQIYTKRKLGGGDDHKPSRDWSVSHGHCVYPVITFRNQLSRLTTGEAPPCGQHHLCEKGANREHEHSVECGFVATIEYVN